MDFSEFLAGDTGKKKRRLFCLNEMNVCTGHGNFDNNAFYEICKQRRGT